MMNALCTTFLIHLNILTPFHPKQHSSMLLVSQLTDKKKRNEERKWSDLRNI